MPHRITKETLKKSKNIYFIEELQHGLVMSRSRNKDYNKRQEAGLAELLEFLSRQGTITIDNINITDSQKETYRQLKDATKDAIKNDTDINNNVTINNVTKEFKEKFPGNQFNLLLEHLEYQMTFAIRNLPFVQNYELRTDEKNVAYHLYQKDQCLFLDHEAELAVCPTDKDGCDMREFTTNLGKIKSTFKLTDKGFELVETTTDSDLTNKIFKGVSPEEDPEAFTLKNKNLLPSSEVKASSDHKTEASSSQDAQEPATYLIKPRVPLVMPNIEYDTDEDNEAKDLPIIAPIKKAPSRPYLALFQATDKDAPNGLNLSGIFSEIFNHDNRYSSNTAAFLGWPSDNSSTTVKALTYIFTLGFLAPVKNVLKLGLEFVPALIQQAAKTGLEKCNDFFRRESLGWRHAPAALAWIICGALYYTMKVARQITMRVTSPIRSIKEAYQFGKKAHPIVGVMLGVISGLVSLTAIGALAFIAAPVVLAKIGLTAVASLIKAAASAVGSYLPWLKPAGASLAYAAEGGIALLTGKTILLAVATTAMLPLVPFVLIKKGLGKLYDWFTAPGKNSHAVKKGTPEQQSREKYRHSNAKVTDNNYTFSNNNDFTDSRVNNFDLEDDSQNHRRMSSADMVQTLSKSISTSNQHEEHNKVSDPSQQNPKLSASSYTGSPSITFKNLKLTPPSPSLFSSVFRSRTNSEDENNKKDSKQSDTTNHKPSQI